ncbi:MAG TPA: hypothetical protein VF686_08660 [Brevundimonas sp.]|jgi:hypothetical protein
MRSVLARIADRRDVREIAAAVAIGVVCLIAGLWWLTDDLNSAGRAARAAVRDALGDPELNVGKPDIRPHPTINGERSHLTLVCGRIRGDPERPFAALVKEHRRRDDALSWFPGTGDRVEQLALFRKGPLTPDQTALLAACDAGGL